ncbi:glycosyltransferase family A protein [Leptolyngbya sp. FACHB-711]|uniref:glycosyltransferase family 2 protein n=1 Tax=Leptolyngbya sp. FACHB-711 TaxID=2692813 RepID=UPI001689ADF9|nr:glycosyltransferase family A protein [Leptolyngbya sp. FACHB-711]MBD2028217.1 glycosyltransferase family 2 protein [Leptolyngbya sp. FACHB-711]
MKYPKLTLLTCTHNGERTIQQALEAIANQTDISRDLFEVLVVDNASSDRTVQIATETIERSGINGRVLTEPRLGKMNALLKGTHEAKSELISIIDDDNFIEPGFIRYTLEIFDQYPDVCVIGSFNRIFVDQSPPPWFKWVSGQYACSPPWLADIETVAQGSKTIARTASIPGAGSTFRVKPLRQCIEKGYSFFNDTQRGKNMSVTGEDLELCWLMRSLGYKFAYDPRIQIRHAIDPERLNLKYFELLCRTQGGASLGTDPFMFTYKYCEEKWPIQWTWQWQLLSKLKRYFILVFFPGEVGKSEEERRFRNWVSKVYCSGQIKRIMVERSNYTKHIRQVAAGEWTELRVL